MATITNELSGSGKIVARIDVLEQVTRDMEGSRVAWMNTDLGVVRAWVAFQLGKREILSHVVHLHAMSVRSWYAGCEALVNGTSPKDREIVFGMESPELTMSAGWLRGEFGSRDDERWGRTLDFAIGLDPGIFDEAPMITGEFVGFRFMPSAESVFAFSHCLLSEVESVLDS